MLASMRPLLSSRQLSLWSVHARELRASAACLPQGHAGSAQGQAAEQGRTGTRGSPHPRHLPGRPVEQAVLSLTPPLGENTLEKY